MSKNINTPVSSLIGNFGGLTGLARALGHKNASTVQGWKNAGRIPDWRRLEVEAACRVKGISCDPSVFAARDKADA